MIGRQITPSDREIFHELQREWGAKIKLDFDMVNEPCIFFRYNSGPFELVYKLSATGSYKQKRWHYVQQAHRAIIELCKEYYEKEQNTKQDAVDHEDFMKQRDKFRKEGFRDDLPSE